MNNHRLQESEIVRSRFATDMSSKSLQLIDEVCSRFESDWQSGQIPVVEEYLQLVQQDLRSPLLIELLLLDIDYRTQAGQFPVRSDYDTRFPDETQAIENAFRESGEATLPVESRDYVPSIDTLRVGTRLRLQRFHAQGGLGTVYAARDESLGRDVAIKFSRRSVPSDAEQSRLAREAAITGRLEHPGIVPVYAAGELENGVPCYVMQMIEGRTLQDAIAELHSDENSGSNKFHSRAFRQLIQRVIAVCNTIAYAHEQHVIHRDIKPKNIMLGRFGETILLDWGLAKQLADVPIDCDRVPEPTMTAMENGATCPGQPIGTPAYASPEQILGKIDQQDLRTDIYSIGATLFCVVVGQQPSALATAFLANDQPITESNVPSPRELNHCVPRQLDAICRRAMAFDREDRYSTATELADDLESYLADEAVSVLNESMLMATRRWLRKHPRISAAIASSLLVTLLGLSAGSYLLSKKTVALAASNDRLALAQQAQQTANEETLAALRSLTDRVIERSLSQNPTLLQEDKEFMRNVIDRYKSLADLQQDPERATDIKIEGLYRVGQLKKFLGQKQEALRMWHDALALCKRPVAEESPITCDIIARIHSRIGLLLTDMGQSEEAIAHTESGVKIFQDLYQTYPGNADYAIGLARSYSELGVSLHYAENIERAANAFERSLELTIPIQTRDSADRYLHQQMATDLSNLGSAQQQLRKFNQADQNYQRAIALYDELVDNYPAAHMYRLNLARTYLGYASLKRQLQEPQLALSYCQRSIDITRSLHESFPLIPDYVYQLGVSQYELGILLSKTDAQKALDTLDIARLHVREAIEKSEAKFRYRQQLMSILFLTCHQLRKVQAYDRIEPYIHESLKTAQLQLDEFERFSTRCNLARALINLGSLQMHRKEYRKVLQTYGKANEQLDTLRLDPRWLETRKMRIVIHRALGNGHLQLDHMKQAAHHWQQAFLLSGSRQPALGVLSAYCASHHDPQEALKQIDFAAELAGLQPQHRFNLACAAAVCAKGLTDAARESAVEQMYQFLASAREHGYFRNGSKFREFCSNQSFSDVATQPRFIAFKESIQSELEARTFEARTYE